MQRIERLMELAALQADQALILHKPSNIFYLSGFTGEGLLLVAQGMKAIVTDFRYTEQAQQQAPGFELLVIDNQLNHVRLAAKALEPLHVQRIRYEDDHVTVKAFIAMQEAFPGITFESLALLPEKLRMRKDAQELLLMERACAISCEAFDWILGEIKPGMTETDIRLKLDFKVLSLGADGMAFSTIIASGPNGSLPHAVPGPRKVEKGDMITLDFGAKYSGYCADMTRTIAVGEPKAEMRKIYAIVQQAQAACQDLLAPGKDCRAIDQVARDIIGEAGYGQYFGHGLGHAVGIDIHEEPRLSPKAEATLEPGMVMTVEPGIYVPGLGGVRIENSCVITDTGARSLVTAPRDLIIL